LISASRISATGQNVFQTLKDDIVFGRLHPRERLVEIDLAQRFKCNRANIREALNELAKLGLVEYVANKGVSVVHLTIVDIQEIYAVRIELEALAAEWIRLPVADEDIAELQEIQDRHTSAIEKKSFPEIFEHNASFHEKLNSLCENRHLMRLIREMAFRALPIRYSAYMSQSYLDDVRDDHLGIIQALREQDRDGLVAMTRKHNQRGLDWYKSQPDFARQ
jgi:DNA-binding GntR family transcriptional regulator